MGNQNVLKSSQEQAVASWINYLNQIRINRLIESLSIENQNWENATTTIKYSLQGTTQGRYLTGGVPPVRFSM